MIPSINGFLPENFEIKKQPTHTYKMNVNDKSVRGYTNNLKAMEQVIYKILMTERYQYSIYSWNYGIELLDLYGEPFSYVCPELERRISEALLWDDRIENVDNFKFDILKKGTIHVSFTIYTIFGNIQAEKEVNF
jgi:hypothetical protein